MTPPATRADPVLEVTNLSHRLWDIEREQEFVVSVPELRVAAGSFVAVLGPNGCGKTTLLTVLGLLRRPTQPAGLSFILRTPAAGGDPEATHDIVAAWRRPRRIEEFRRRYLGFALQSGELLPALTVRENIAVPLRVNGWSPAAVRARVDALLDGFGLLKGSTTSRLADSRVNKLSGGEYQRVALARAVAHRPAVVFVDEPTASLNRHTARLALGQLTGLQRESGGATTVIMITHDNELAGEFADTIIEMKAAGPTRGELADVRPNRPAAGGA